MTTLLDKPAGGGAWAAAGYVAAAAVALAVYGVTMAPDLVWHDAGYYQWESARLNLVRPGETVRVHPFFVVLAHYLGKLGIWNYAKAASVASALGTAIAVANVWLIVLRLVRCVGAASVAALACLLAHTIWQMAVQPQTYGWSNAALSGMILATVLWVQTGRTAWLMTMFFVGGVGFSIHLMSQMGLGVLGAWVLVRVIRGGVPAWVLPAGVAMWLVGGALDWYVIALEYQRTGDAVATLESSILGGWGGAVFNVSGVPRMLLRSLLMLVLNFPTPVMLVAVYGVWRSGRILAESGGRGKAASEAVAAKTAPSGSERASGARSLAVVLGVLLAVYVLFGVRYRVPNQNFFFTPVYLILCIYLGLGIHSLGWLRRPATAALTVALVLAVIPAYWAMARTAKAAGINLRESGTVHEIPYRDFYDYYLMPWQQGQTGPRRFAEKVLASLPPNAVLLPDTTTAPPLKCLRDVEGVRPDVLIVDAYDVKFDPAVAPWWRGQAADVWRMASGRRVFVASDQANYVPRWAREDAEIVPFGLIFEVRPRQAGATP